MRTLKHAVLPLLAGMLAVSPAYAGITDDVTSFFGRVATNVKTQVVSLPGHVASLPEHLGLVSSRMDDAPSLADRLTPAAAVQPRDVALAADLSQVTPPRIAAADVAPPAPSVEHGARKLFCAEYARIRMGFPVLGDAKYWWGRARSLFDRVAEPVVDSVMVFSTSRRLKLGHVAVVTHIVGPREIRVDQANWMNKGEIDHSTPVLDVSPNNDWSQVRVWDVPSQQFGARTYRISGFIVRPPVRQAMNDR